MTWRSRSSDARPPSACRRGRWRPDRTLSRPALLATPRRKARNDPSGDSSGERPADRSGILPAPAGAATGDALRLGQALRVERTTSHQRAQDLHPRPMGWRPDGVVSNAPDHREVDSCPRRATSSAKRVLPIPASPLQSTNPARPVADKARTSSIPINSVSRPTRSRSAPDTIRCHSNIEHRSPHPLRGNAAVTRPEWVARASGEMCRQDVSAPHLTTHLRRSAQAPPRGHARGRTLLEDPRHGPLSDGLVKPSGWPGSISLTVFPAVFISRFRRPGIGRRR